MDRYTFWNRVRALLGEKRMTQKYLADNSGMVYSTLRSMMSKEIMPPAEDAYKIAGTLGTSVEYLISGKKINNSAQIAEIGKLLEKVNAKLDALKYGVTW